MLVSLLAVCRVNSSGCAPSSRANMRAAQVQHALVGGPGQGVLGDEGGRAAQHEHADEDHRHQPQRDVGLAKAVVEQRLHQRWQHRLGQRHDQRGANGHRNAVPAGLEVRREAGKTLKQGRHGVGARHAGRAAAAIITVTITVALRSAMASPAHAAPSRCARAADPCSNRAAPPGCLQSPTCGVSARSAGNCRDGGGSMQTSRSSHPRAGPNPSSIHPSTQ